MAPLGVRSSQAHQAESLLVFACLGLTERQCAPKRVVAFWRGGRRPSVPKHIEHHASCIPDRQGDAHRLLGIHPVRVVVSKSTSYDRGRWVECVSVEIHTHIFVSAGGKGGYTVVSSQSVSVSFNFESLNLFGGDSVPSRPGPNVFLSRLSHSGCHCGRRCAA